MEFVLYCMFLICPFGASEGFYFGVVAVPSCAYIIKHCTQSKQRAQWRSEARTQENHKQDHEELVD